MSNQLLILLRKRHDELAAISPDLETWPKIKEWHAKARPLMTQHFADQVDSFDSTIKIQWKRSAGMVTVRRSRSSAGRSGTQSRERQARSRQVQTAHAKLLAQIDALIELQNIDTDGRDTHESDAIFAAIDRLVGSSLLPQQFKDIVCSDIADAQQSYRAGSYKGCVVMLGAALEGIMLGTLQRPDVVVHLSNASTVPGPIRSIGTRDPALADKIGNELSFEDYKVCIHELIPGSDALGVDDIQAFRNAIHPWKTIREPLKYAAFDRSRALHYVGSLHKIIEALYQWAP